MWTRALPLICMVFPVSCFCALACLLNARVRLADDHTLFQLCADGTVVAQRYMMWAPAGQAGTIVVDGLVSMAGYNMTDKAIANNGIPSKKDYETNPRNTFALWDYNGGNTFEIFLEHCANDPTCSSYLGKTKDEVISFVKKVPVEYLTLQEWKDKAEHPPLNARQYSTGYVTDDTKLAYYQCATHVQLGFGVQSREFQLRAGFMKLIFFVFSVQQNLRQFTPVILYRLNRCNGDDQRVIGNGTRPIVFRMTSILWMVSSYVCMFVFPLQ